MMSTPIHTTIRQGVPADAPALHAIIQASYRGTHENAWTNESHLVAGERIGLAELQSMLAGEADTQPFLVAQRIERDGAVKLLGCIQIQTHGCAQDEAMFGLLAVSPELQGCGTGGQLVRAALATMKQSMGKRHAKLWVLHARTELIAWYEKLGFRPTGETEPFPRPDLAKQDLYFDVYAMEL